MINYTTRPKVYNLEDSILSTISWTLNIPSAHLNPYTHLRDDLLLDQVDVLLLIATLESKLNLFLSEEEAAEIEMIGDFKRYFTRYAA